MIRLPGYGVLKNSYVGLAYTYVFTLKQIKVECHKTGNKVIQCLTVENLYISLYILSCTVV